MAYKKGNQFDSYLGLMGLWKATAEWSLIPALLGLLFKNVFNYERCVTLMPFKWEYVMPHILW